MSMTVNHSLYNSYAAQNADAGIKKEETESKAKGAGRKKQENEVKQPQLSQAAQKLLDKLRDTYSNMDFMVADFKNADEAKAALSRGTKEVSVLFSSEELEKMASDEKYEKEYMDRVQGALRMSDEINKKFGYESAFGKDGSSEITKIGISFNSDGTTTFFAELEKSSVSQRERIEQRQEERRTQKKEDAKKAEREKQKKRLEEKTDQKRTTVHADSMEELLEKIREVDWNIVRAGNEPEVGRKFDFSI